jgi:hypothetical protein
VLLEAQLRAAGVLHVYATEHYSEYSDSLFEAGKQITGGVSDAAHYSIRTP